MTPPESTDNERRPGSEPEPAPTLFDNNWSPGTGHFGFIEVSRYIGYAEGGGTAILPPVNKGIMRIVYITDPKAPPYLIQKVPKE